MRPDASFNLMGLQSASVAPHWRLLEEKIDSQSLQISLKHYYSASAWLCTIKSNNMRVFLAERWIQMEMIRDDWWIIHENKMGPKQKTKLDHLPFPPQPGSFRTGRLECVWFIYNCFCCCLVNSSSGKAAFSHLLSSFPHSLVFLPHLLPCKFSRFIQNSNPHLHSATLYDTMWRGFQALHHVGSVGGNALKKKKITVIYSFLL